MGRFKHHPLSPDPLFTPAASIPVLPGWKEGDPQPTSTYFSRTQPDDFAEGVGAAPKHHQEKTSTTLVGESPAPYPRQPAESPWHHDATEAQPFDYRAASDRQLQRRRAFAALAQKEAVAELAVVERAQAIIDQCDAEIRRRSR